VVFSAHQKQKRHFYFFAIFKRSLFIKAWASAIVFQQAANPLRVFLKNY